MTESEPIHRVQIEDDHVDAQIVRINELTRVGRTNWFGLLAYLAFATVTVLGVEDADFFLETRQTTLPLIGVSIPTLSFFLFAPILGAALYIYLHLHIRKLGQAVKAPKPFPRGTEDRLEHYLNSWLLVDVLLTMRRDGAIEKRPLDVGARWLTILLVWWAGPLVLVLFWWWSWPAHSWLLTLGLLFLSMTSAWAGLISWQTVTHYLTAKRTPLVPCVATRTSFFAIFLALGAIGAVKTELGSVRALIGPTQTVPETRVGRAMAWLRPVVTDLYSADLRNLQTIPLPLDQRDFSTARRQYRIEWCARIDLEFATCGPDVDWRGQIPPSVLEARNEWCINNPGETLGRECDSHFEWLEREFRFLWRNFRNTQFVTLGPPNLSGRDLRNANLSGAQLQGANLSGARLQGAYLFEASLEGASLTEAYLSGAFLRGAHLQNADLFEADLRGANFFEAALPGAILQNVDARGANFYNSNLRGAILRSAQLSGAYLRQVQLQGGNLNGAELHGADLFAARVEGTINIATAEFHGAAILQVDGPSLQLLAEHRDWASMFFQQEVVSYEDFIAQWRAWAATLDPPVTIAPDYLP